MDRYTVRDKDRPRGTSTRAIGAFVRGEESWKDKRGSLLETVETVERVESGSNVFHLRLPACWPLLLHDARSLRIVVATTAAYP